MPRFKTAQPLPRRKRCSPEKLTTVKSYQRCKANRKGIPNLWYKSVIYRSAGEIDREIMHRLKKKDLRKVASSSRVPYWWDLNKLQLLRELRARQVDFVRGVPLNPESPSQLPPLRHRRPLIDPAFARGAIGDQDFRLF